MLRPNNSIRKIAEAQASGLVIDRDEWQWDSRANCEVFREK